MLKGRIRADAGNASSNGMRQKIWRGAVVNDEGLTDDIEFSVGTYTSKLQGAIDGNIGARSLIVMPVKALR